MREEISEVLGVENHPGVSCGDGVLKLQDPAAEQLGHVEIDATHVYVDTSAS